MSKKITKIVAIAVLLTGCGSLLINPLCVNAAETSVVILDNYNNTNTNTSKELLTLDKAIEYAVENSDTLKLYDTKFEYQDKIDDANGKLEDATDVDSDTKDYNDDTRELNLNILKQKKDFEEDKLIKKVTDSYKAIVSSQVQIDNLEKQYAVQKKKLEDAKLMNKLEISTYINVEDFEINMKTLRNNISTLNDNLNNSKASFKNLIGKDVSDFRFDTSIEYSLFKIDGDENEYFDSKINEYLQYNEEMLDLNEDYIDDNEVDNPGKFDEDKPKESDYLKNIDIKTNPEVYTQKAEEYKKAITSYSESLTKYTTDVSARIKYLQSKLSLEENKVSLEEQKKNLKDALRSYYTLLNSKDSEIKILRQKIYISKQKTNIAKQKYDLGLITKSEYDSSNLDTDSLQLDLRKAVDEYDSTKEKIEKPWIGLS